MCVCACMCVLERTSGGGVNMKAKSPCLYSSYQSLISQHGECMWYEKVSSRMAAIVVKEGDA